VRNGLGRIAIAPLTWRFALSVAEFNVRAIGVYERAGFVTTRQYMHETNGGVHPFVEMERPA